MSLAYAANWLDFPHSDEIKLRPRGGQFALLAAPFRHASLLDPHPQRFVRYMGTFWQDPELGDRIKADESLEITVNTGGAAVTGIAIGAPLDRVMTRL